MKKFLNVFLFCALILVGCSENERLDIVNDGDLMEERLSSRSIDLRSTSWQKQLAYALDSTPSILLQNGIKLLSYREEYMLESQEQIVKLKQLLLAEDAYFPIVEDNTRNYMFIKRKDIEYHEVYKNRYAFEVISRSLDSLLKIGDLVLMLTWEYRGETLYSLCIVDNQEGFVYDNVISHLFIVEERKIEHKGELYEVICDVKRLQVRSSESGGGIDIGGGINIGGGNTGGGNTGGENQWKEQPVYKVDSRELAINNVIGAKLGSVVFKHVAKGIGSDGVVKMTSSTMEAHARAYGNSLAEFRYVERRMGIDGISYARVAYYVSNKSVQLKIVWENSNAKIEGSYDNNSTATGIAETILLAKEGGWLMGEY